MSEPDGIKCGPKEKDVYYCYACNKRVKMPTGPDSSEKCPNCGKAVWEYMATHKIK